MTKQRIVRLLALPILASTLLLSGTPVSKQTYSVGDATAVTAELNEARTEQAFIREAIRKQRIADQKNDVQPVNEQPKPKEEQPKQVQVAVSRGGDPFAYSKVVNIQATAYVATGHRTATGTWPKRGTISIDPRFIPLGTKVYVEGYGYGVTEDTGSAIKGNIVDLFMTSQQEAVKWGRRNVKMYILK